MVSQFLKYLVMVISQELPDFLTICVGQRHLIFRINYLPEAVMLHFSLGLVLGRVGRFLRTEIYRDLCDRLNLLKKLGFSRNALL